MIINQNATVFDSSYCFDTSVEVPLVGLDQGSLQLVYTNLTPGSAKTFTDTDVSVDDNTIKLTAHGLITGTKISGITTDGTLPAGISLLTVYYVIYVDADTIKLATTLANAKAGTAVNITDAGTEGAANAIAFAALSGCSVALHVSNDGVNFMALSGVAANITAAGNVIWDLVDKYYKTSKVVIACAAGQISLKGILYGKKY